MLVSRNEQGGVEERLEEDTALEHTAVDELDVVFEYK